MVVLPLSRGENFPGAAAAGPFKGGNATSAPVVPPSGEPKEASKCCLKALENFQIAAEHHGR